MSRKITSLIVCVVLVSLVVLLANRDTLAQDTGITQSNVAVSLFWHENPSDVLLKGNADGSGTPVTCLTIAEDVRGTVVDVAGGKLYWLERSTNRLRRANLNCTGAESLSGDMSNPDRLTLDASANRLYWTENNGTNRIQRANLDGSNIVTVLSGLGLPVGVAADSTNGFLYWTEQEPPGVWRATLGGANKTKIIPLDANSVPLDIAVDVARGRIYWINSTQGAIYTATLAGGNPTLWLNLPDPRYVLVDPNTGQVYWSDFSANEIHRANADTSNNQLLFSAADGVDQPRGLSLYQTATATCYTLTRNHTGQGSDPTATPNKSTGCGAGQYVAGEVISLSASPSAGWRVAGWGGTNNDGSTNTTNTVTMPAGNHTVSVAYEQIPITCYTLTRTHSGSGNNPVATPASSTGCGTGQYTAGQSISLTASPETGWRVAGWGGTNNDGSTSTTNTVTMPAANHTVSVAYEQIPITCYTLTRTHSGSGNNPVATPASSTGCGTGQYTAGQSISLTASPTNGWRVAGWGGTNNDASTSTTNTVTMPAANHTVSVAYEQIPITCYTLTRTHSGSGNNPVATPASSTGCGTGQYTAGQSISLTASPAAGWRVAGWGGTNNDASTSTANTVTMPAGNHTVTVIYDQQPIVCYTLTRTHSGSGNNPVADPALSQGCGTGQYVAGESIALSATPAAGWRVAGWDGTNNDASTSTTNTVVMPAAAYTVSVVYEQVIAGCYTLTRGHSGQGSDPTAAPDKSDGCSAGQYVAGEGITLTATPAAGWSVSGWQGTDNDTSVATSNHIIMPAANYTVAVTYAQRPLGNRAVIPFVLYGRPYFLGPMEIEPNNVFSQANGPILLNRTYHGYPNDRDDLFYFELSTTRSVTISLENITGKDPQLHLRDAGNNLIGDIVARPPHVLIRSNLPPGRYYVRIVVVAENNTDHLYTLRVD